MMKKVQVSPAVCIAYHESASEELVSILLDKIRHPVEQSMFHLTADKVKSAKPIILKNIEALGGRVLRKELLSCMVEHDPRRHRMNAYWQAQLINRAIKSLIKDGSLKHSRKDRVNLREDVLEIAGKMVAHRGVEPRKSPL